MCNFEIKKIESNHFLVRVSASHRNWVSDILYQLKMILEKTLPPTDVSIVRKTGKLGNNEPALKLGS